MTTPRASFDRWWNGVSLRAKITGVTVLLLTFGLAVAGAGTMSVLRGYLQDQADVKVDQLFAQASKADAATIASCNYAYDPNSYLFMVLDSSGSPECSNVPKGTKAPATGSMTLAWAYGHR